MAVKFDTKWEWTPPKKVKCEECFEKVSHLAIIKLYGVKLCVDCYEHNCGTGQ